MLYIKSNITVFVTVAFLLLINGNCFGQNYSSRISILGNSIDEKTYTASDINGILKGKFSSWKNGNGVIIILRLNDDEESQHLAQQIYNKSITGVKKYWLGIVFSGRANSPLFADSNEEVLSLLKKNIGAIAVLVDYKGEIPAEFTVDIAKSSE
tara:strand:+ start:90 stop:551 length:462 start_codon:yes stop_codon:yes gene_type:complete